MQSEYRTIISKNNEKIQRQLSKCEKNWQKWSDSEIYCWFKYVCVSWNINNNQSGIDNINWNCIENKLKIKEWNGNYLTICNENELKKLGFKNDHLVSHIVSCINTLTAGNNNNNNNSGSVNENKNCNDKNDCGEKEKEEYDNSNARQVKLNDEKCDLKQENKENAKKNKVKRSYDDICDHVYKQRLDANIIAFECACKEKILVGATKWYRCIKCNESCCHGCYDKIANYDGKNDATSPPPSKKRRC